MMTRCANYVAARFPISYDGSSITLRVPREPFDASRDSSRSFFGRKGEHAFLNKKQGGSLELDWEPDGLGKLSKLLGTWAGVRLRLGSGLRSHVSHRKSRVQTSPPHDGLFHRSHPSGWSDKKQEIPASPPCCREFRNVQSEIKHYSTEATAVALRAC